MTQIKNKDTEPEIRLCQALWNAGLRYRKHATLPGKPDIVFTKQRVALFVDGCFWHGCELHFVVPKTNSVFWQDKISANVARDRSVDSQLIDMGWKVLRVWEHDIRNNLEWCVLMVQKKVYSADLSDSNQY